MNIPSLPDTFPKMMVAVGFALVTGSGYGAISQLTSLTEARERYAEQVELFEVDMAAWLEESHGSAASEVPAPASTVLRDNERALQQREIHIKHTANRLRRREEDVYFFLKMFASALVLGCILIIDYGHRWRTQDEQRERLQQLQLATAEAELEVRERNTAQRKNRS